MWPGILVCSLILQNTYNVAAILELNLAAHLNEIEILLIIEGADYSYVQYVDEPSFSVIWFATPVYHVQMRVQLCGGYTGF